MATPGGYGTFTMVAPAYNDKIGDIVTNQFKWVQQNLGEREANKRKAQVEMLKQKKEDAKLFVLAPEEVQGYYKETFVNAINNDILPQLGQLNEMYSNTGDSQYLQKAEALKHESKQIAGLFNEIGKGYENYAQAINKDPDYSPYLNSENEDFFKSIYDGKATYIPSDKSPNGKPSIQYNEPITYDKETGKAQQNTKTVSISDFYADFQSRLPKKATKIDETLAEFGAKLDAQRKSDNGFNSSLYQTWDLPNKPKGFITNKEQAQLLVDKLAGENYQRPSNEILEFWRKRSEENRNWKPKTQEEFDKVKSEMVEFTKSNFNSKIDTASDPTMALDIANKKADLEGQKLENQNKRETIKGSKLDNRIKGQTIRKNDYEYKTTGTLLTTSKLLNANGTPMDTNQPLKKDRIYQTNGGGVKTLTKGTTVKTASLSFFNKNQDIVPRPITIFDGQEAMVQGVIKTNIPGKQPYYELRLEGGTQIVPTGAQMKTFESSAMKDPEFAQAFRNTQRRNPKLTFADYLIDLSDRDNTGILTDVKTKRVKK